ncbi:MAG: NAD-dependent 4,6-dehydratase LegB [Candidatus Margulisbacteria bacterium]|nr:NAD-dependent 4,6-dehydratase LegB [Candidatus Margulisiibacteriota bacterium]MBU1022113.1 NAD-dependent 4,6-dehydratase LegB [Candidatus Margulisiibacteriota bacterium]MBU1728629.1 NAD-dependent 4,6-dehydratase LegB [Candidatus Margulisiibacteriota bacterium]MBU1955080.1 NAD-dependent 4,6-dehydratase LegB [Candidatus Margulisiibacteriota bacterium]
MSLKNKKVLVTGAEGFIGSYLVEELLNRGAKVRAFVLYNFSNSWGWLDTLKKEDQAKIEIFTGNICEAYNVRKAMEGVDVVFHLGALIAIPYSYYSPESYVSTNVMGTLNVLQAAREAKVEKFVHTSTSETYGTAIYVPIDEKHPLQGQSPYSASKIGADMIAESFYRSFGMPVAICRPFNTFGPRQSARAIIPTIISQIAAGKKKIKLGSLTPVRDLTFVRDTALGFVKIAESSKSIGEVINLGSGVGITIGDLVEKIITLMGTKVEIECEEKRVRPEKSEVMKLICNNKKALEYVGWKPAYSLDQGLTETIDYIKNNLNYYKPDIYNV